MVPKTPAMSTQVMEQRSELKQSMPRSQGRRGSTGEISRTAVAREVQDKSVELLEEQLANNTGGLALKQSLKLRNLLDHHTRQFRSQPASMDLVEDDDDEQLFCSNFLLDLRRLQRKLSDVTLKELEEVERKRNEERHPSRRCSDTIIKVNAWHQHQTLKQAVEISQMTPARDWFSSVYKCDPRYQIMKFFDEVAREGGKVRMEEQTDGSSLVKAFSKASVFTVWRPTSIEAIRNMMLGVACGKGLDIKGKSAKRGNISSYVPFIQVFEQQHKEVCKEYLNEDGTIRVFFKSSQLREQAHKAICEIVKRKEVTGCPAPQDLNVKYVDTYTTSKVPVFGLDIDDRVFWKSYVMMQDYSRPKGSEWDTGRHSQPEYFSMNLDALRKEHESPDEPQAVVYQMSETNPMEPRMLLMAYEEGGGVKPVVSDFDCFVLGTRGVRYNRPIPAEQVELLQWSVKNIGQVLDKRAETGSTDSWVKTWLELAADYHPDTPRFGNGDPKTYEIIEVGVSRLLDTGCVRHGAECFNWWFPQDIDDEFLVISDTLPGRIKWKKMNVHELQDILIQKIDEGFTFPINPKWVLCDSGWRRVYDKLLASQHPNVQDSLNCWLPPDTGLREQIDEISARHPCGFILAEGNTTADFKTLIEMCQLQVKMENKKKIRRAWTKVKASQAMRRV